MSKDDDSPDPLTALANSRARTVEALTLVALDLVHQVTDDARVDAIVDATALGASALRGDEIGRMLGINGSALLWVLEQWLQEDSGAAKPIDLEEVKRRAAGYDPGDLDE